MTLKASDVNKPKDPMDGYDTTVQCKNCGRKEHLNFINGLKNGWSKCCGYTMPIVACTANMDEVMNEGMKPYRKAVKEILKISERT